MTGAEDHAVPTRARERTGRMSVVDWLVETPEKLSARTSAKDRRAVHFWLTVFWVTGGTLLWLWLRDALWFVGFMSLYAIWISHLAGWSAETPAEVEEIGADG